MRAPDLAFQRAKALRRTMTLPEVVLWRALRGRRLGDLRFRRQHPIGPYILDFYCPSARLAIEIDSAAHDGAVAAAHDARRDAWLAGEGIKVLRVMATDVLRDERLEGVLLAITQVADSASVPAAPSTAFGGPPPPSPRATGEDHTS